MKQALADLNGVLGLNRRNAEFILPRNLRKYYPRVDDKIKTKDLLEAQGIPTPPIYFKFQYFHELGHLEEIRRLSQFVVKPARGSAGRGILVITGWESGKWITASGRRVTKEDLEYHIANILGGLYSLDGKKDCAFLEYFVHCQLQLKQMAFQGVPDIRIILFLGVPVMAMLRLPTRLSGGRANLHQGAVGVGIHFKTGETSGGVLRNRYIDTHPDLGKSLQGIKIPIWNQLLEIAVKAYPIFGLGYFGIDFVVDQLLGPLILEVNARPGLSIQLANRSGLLPKLRKIEAAESRLGSFSDSDRLEFALDL